MIGAPQPRFTNLRRHSARKMFRRLSQHFPDFSANGSSDAGDNAHAYLKRALLFGALLVGVSIGAPFLLSDPQPPTPPPSSENASTPASETAVDRTPAPADPSPVNFDSPGVIIAFILLAGGIGLAVYLRNQDVNAAPENNLFAPVAEYALSTDQTLQLIRCGDDLLLLAVSSNDVTLLKTYPADEMPMNGELPSSENESVVPRSNGSGGNAFATVLKRYASQYASRHQS